MDEDLVEKLRAYREIQQYFYRYGDIYQIRKLIKIGKIEEARKLAICKAGEDLKKRVSHYVRMADEKVLEIFNEALKTALEIDDPRDRDLALESIVRLWDDVDGYEAIKVAMKINDPECRVENLKYLIYYSDLDEISDDNAREILGAVMEVVENIMDNQSYDDNYDKNLMKENLIQFLARFDTDKALEMARMQKSECEKVDILCRITRSIKNTDPEKANSILNEAMNTLRSINDAYTLTYAISAILPCLEKEKDIYECWNLPGILRIAMQGGRHWEK